MALVVGGNGDTCVFMLHADGDDDGQTFVDDCYGGTDKTLTAYYGTYTTWDDVKFGIGSLYCTGSPGSYLAVDPSTDFRFAEQDFTIDFWLRCALGANAYPFAWYYDEDNYFALERVASSGTTAKFRARYVLASVEIFNAAMTTYVDTAGKWTHFEITRVGATVRLFVGGVLKATDTASSSTFGANFEDWTLYIGASLLNGLAGLKSLNGYIDEFRILRGEAAHTGPFPPWSNAYSAPNDCTMRGTYLVRRTQTAAQRGIYGVGVSTVRCRHRGAYTILHSQLSAMRGVYTVETTWVGRVRGTYGIVLDRTVQKRMAGLYKIRRTTAGAHRGMHIVGVDTVVCRLRGMHKVYRAVSAKHSGRHLLLERTINRIRGTHSIENTAVELYEHYYSVTSPPDLTGAPTETSASLPHTTAALGGGAGFYYLYTQKVNRWGLPSGPLQMTVIELGKVGEVIIRRPSAPVNVTIEAAASAAVRVTAEYRHGADEDRAADTWLIYLTNDGSDPDPDLDTPTEVSMVRADGVAYLDWTSSNQGDGNTVKAIVRTARSSDDRESSNTAIVSTTATIDAPDAVTVQTYHRFPGGRVPVS